VALVTGGGSGIGRASARAFGAAGAVVVVVDIDASLGEETAENVRADGGTAHAIKADVTEASEVARLFAEVVRAHGRLDCAHNNAGITGAACAMAEYPDDEWDRVMAINLRSVFLCMKQEISQMLRQGGGAIVNTSSGAGLVGFASLPAYVASKHGVIGLTRSAAVEYANRNIRINAICPGSTRTPMLEGFIDGDPTVERFLTAAQPIGRLGAPDEVAAAAVWLCSDEASFVVGHAMAVDGGAVAQ
jgi:NAD(P)-dependent dehydrogenase (short-subunit alcohol dehydrogenase family)